MKKVDGFLFWKNVDTLKHEAYAELARKAHVNYNTMRNQRSQNILPNGFDMYAISKILNVSMEYLIMGKPASSQRYISKAEKIMKELSQLSQRNLEAITILVESLSTKPKSEKTSLSGT
jgi:hypothetical protein